MRRGSRMLVVVCCAVAVLAACSNVGSEKKLTLLKYGPEEIRAGQVFNKQPNGESAIWSKAANATKDTVFVLNGVSLQTAVSADGSEVSALVPKELYSKPGEYPLYLLDTKTNKKSNELKFIVKP